MVAVFGMLSTYVMLECWIRCIDVGQGRFMACQGWDMWRPHSTGLYSIHRRSLITDLVMVCKSFHSEVDLGLESLFEVAHAGGHTSVPNKG